MVHFAHEHERLIKAFNKGMHAWVLQDIFAKHIPRASLSFAASASRLSSVVLQDLLQPQNSDLQIREGENGVFVAGVHEVEVNGTEDCLHLLQVGDRNRCTLNPLPQAARV